MQGLIQKLFSFKDKNLDRQIDNLTQGLTQFPFLGVLSTDPTTTSWGVADICWWINNATDTQCLVKFWDGDETQTLNTLVNTAQPAFSVKPSETQSNLANNATIQFGTEIFDQGSDFASHIFTAPVSGKYQFNIAVRFRYVDTASDYSLIRLLTSNRNYDLWIIDPGVLASDPAYWGGMFSVLADMDASDTAYATFKYAAGSQQVDVLRDSYFTGFLVC